MSTSDKHKAIEIVVIEDSASPSAPRFSMQSCCQTQPITTSNTASKRKLRARGRLHLTNVRSSQQRRQPRQTRSMSRKKNMKKKSKKSTKKRKRSPSPMRDPFQPTLFESIANASANKENKKQRPNGLGEREWKQKESPTKPISLLTPTAPKRRSERIQKKKRRKLNCDDSAIIDLCDDTQDNGNDHNDTESNSKMSLDDTESDDVDLVESTVIDLDIQMMDNSDSDSNNTNTNTNTNTNHETVSLIEDVMHNIDINDVRIQLIGIAVGKHRDFWSCNDFDVRPYLTINKHTQSIDLRLASIHGDNVCVSIKSKQIKAIYLPQNSQLFDVYDLSINPSHIETCEEEMNANITSHIQVLFIQTHKALETYQWLREYYNPNDITQPGIERITLFMGCDEYNTLKRDWCMNQIIFADMHTKIEHTLTEERDIWLKNIRFGRGVKRRWKKYDCAHTKEHIHGLLSPDNTPQPVMELEGKETETKESEAIEISLHTSMNMDINVNISFDEYIENEEIILNPHHSNSLSYAKSRRDEPSKTLECYYVFPAQHSHRQNIMHVETKDLVKVTIEDEYLNDTIVDFQLKYTYASWPASFKKKVYIFTSFFWKKLTKMKSKHTTEEQMRQVLRWTKHIKNLFDKEYILIPKCEHQHWELVIVCYPQKVLSKYLQSLNSDSDNDNDNNTEEKDTHMPCIAILDSLLGTYKSSDFNLIRKWLDLEARNYMKKFEMNKGNCNRKKNSKLEIDSDDDCDSENEKIFDSKSIKGYCCRVPRQPNGHDCGCFLLRNVLQFGKDGGFADTSSKKQMDLGKWYKPKRDGVAYRKDIADRLARLIDEQKVINRRLRLEHENKKKMSIMKQIQTNQEKQKQKENEKNKLSDM